MSYYSIAEKKRLDHACRRGTRELEELVRAFLRLYYDQANTEQKSVFRWLLSMEDTQLWNWIYLWGSDSSKQQTKNTPIVNTQVKQAIDEYIASR